MNNFKLNVEDLNSSRLNLDLYLQQTYKTCNLNEILLFERDLFEEISVFQSDKQTLVYDNYNKFISATNTIGKIKYDFKKMEDEMKLLGSNMESMTIFSDSITCTLQDSHSEMSRILKIHSYLKNIQFLIKLPDKLKIQTQSKKYLEAAQDYLKVQKDLHHYCHLGAFQIIQQEINYILEEIKTNLWESLNCNYTKVKELSYTVNVLLTLREPPKKLADKYIRNVEKQLTKKLVEWNKSPVINLYEYANLGEKLMEELCFFICEFDQMFVVINIPLKETKKSLDRMIKELMTLFFESIQVKIDSLPVSIDSTKISTALQKLYIKIDEAKAVLQEPEYMERIVDIIVKAGRKQSRYHLNELKNFLDKSLLNIRHTLAISSTYTRISIFRKTNKLLTHLVSSLVIKVQEVLEDLTAFIETSQLPYASRPQIKKSFCIDCVREGLIVGFIMHLKASARSFCSTNKNYHTLTLLFISKICLEFDAKYINVLLKLTDKLLGIETRDKEILTTKEELCVGMRLAAECVLTRYVQIQGLVVSQMFRKSIETKDWLHCFKPTSVRSAIKRVLEEITAIETQVGMLNELGSQPENSSDPNIEHSTYFRCTANNQASHYLPACHVYKLFSDKIKKTTVSFEFPKIFIMAGIIKISLQVLVECVRLKTFSRFGMQQLQVDLYYLQIHLCRIISNKNLIQFFLAEILNSAMNRSLDPSLMHGSVVKFICEER